MQSEIEEIERKLALAQDELNQLWLSSRQRVSPEQLLLNRKRYRVLWEHKLEAERELAAAKGETYAIPFDFPVKWCYGASHLHLLSSDIRKFLIFYVQRDNSARFQNANSGKAAPEHIADDRVCLVSIDRCSSVKLGSPNDEVWEGHPLYGKGLDSPSQIIVNSPWLKEIHDINRTHPQYDPKRWASKKHFVLWFKESAVECIADSLTPEIFSEPFDDVLLQAVRRLK